MLSRFHAAINGRASFFYVAEEYFGASACFAFFFHSPIRGHLACFLVLVTVNDAAMNIKGIDLFSIVVSFPVSSYPEVRLLDLMAVLFLVF